MITMNIKNLCPLKKMKKVEKKEIKIRSSKSWLIDEQKESKYFSCFTSQLNTIILRESEESGKLHGYVYSKEIPRI